MSIFDFFNKWNNSREKTNVMDSIMGREAIVTADIDNLKGTGTIVLEGMDWSARSRDGKPIAKDTVVRIVAIEGVKVMVEQVVPPC